MEGLASALQTVLAHAVAAFESEDTNDVHLSLEEYNNAWSSLSYALEVQGTGDRLPALVREICTALLETYSARFEAIRTRPEADTGDGPGSDVGRSPQPASHTASCSGYPVNPYCNGAAVPPGASDPYGVPREAAEGMAPADGSADDGGGTTSRRVRRRFDESHRPPTPTPADVCGVDGGDDGTAAGIAADVADGVGSGKAAAGALGGNGNGSGDAAAADGDGGRRQAGASAVVMTEMMKEVFQTCHRPVPDGSCLDDLAGLGSVKEEVRLALLLPMRMPHLFQGIRQPARSFLLHGPPGTGKTMLVERIAAEAGATLLVLTPGNVLSKWSGESEKQLRAVFEVARAMQPCIVFMDEVDSLAPTRGSGDDPLGRRLLNELLVQMSYLASGPGSGPGSGPTAAATAAGGGGGGASGAVAVYVFAATNRIQDCDPALLRRFDRRVAVPLPDTAARRAFLAGVLARPEVAGHALGGEDVQQLAERTEGYSGSDLAQLCREAAMQPVRQLLREMAAAGGGAGGWARGGGRTAAAAGGGRGGGGGALLGPRLLTMEDFEWALGEVQPAPGNLTRSGVVSGPGGGG